MNVVLEVNTGRKHGFAAECQMLTSGLRFADTTSFSFRLSSTYRSCGNEITICVHQRSRGAIKR